MQVILTIQQNWFKKDLDKLLSYKNKVRKQKPSFYSHMYAN